MKIIVDGDPSEVTTFLYEMQWRQELKKGVYVNEGYRHAEGRVTTRKQDQQSYQSMAVGPKVVDMGCVSHA